MTTELLAYPTYYLFVARAMLIDQFFLFALMRLISVLLSSLILTK